MCTNREPIVHKSSTKRVSADQDVCVIRCPFVNSRFVIFPSILQSIKVFISKDFYIHCKKLIKFGIGSM